ncbi:hypothetical protein PTSG_00331 [Salpingoeca rosetta]|uniref:BLOC-1-related complex subunit 5 n=1 Tax=Salpingoeca rosetta (strain ATCC 50818 / BSB-021) TaxID=946362 RepID=F2TW67_SALR5|nr:uncharacterized protein PTSG_00331 [Salpingoeca rosetta]EGD72313.1 hypothetical protein PTSG_00331 [Salpingoeca rosetta]|eukprot:XP_004998883.1 hypothetical protein PTSG_00331 [Salpingoeca rosetta]
MKLWRGVDAVPPVTRFKRRCNCSKDEASRRANPLDGIYLFRPVSQDPAAQPHLAPATQHALRSEAGPLPQFCRTFEEYTRALATEVSDAQYALAKEVKRADDRVTACMLASERRAVQMRRTSERLHGLRQVGHMVACTRDNTQFLLSQLVQLNEALPVDEQVPLPPILQRQLQQQQQHRDTPTDGRGGGEGDGGGQEHDEEGEGDAEDNAHVQGVEAGTLARDGEGEGDGDDGNGDAGAK